MTGGSKTGETVKCSIYEKYAGKLTVRICENREMMGREAALSVAEKIDELLKKQPFVNIIFASAPSQNEFLEALNNSETIPWDRINAFHMDEYIELPEGHPASFASFLNRKLFGRQTFRSVNYINGNARYIGEECSRYAQLLSERPPDIVCLGIGENGHLAFNDPPVADFNDPSQLKMVKLDDDCRQQQVNDACFPSLAEVPAYAITLTIPALMAGRYVYCVVPGTQKAKAIYNTLNEEISEKFPSTILRKHDNAVLFLDKGSSSLL